MGQGLGRQTLFFTATWPKSVQRVAASLLKNPIQVGGAVGVGSEGLAQGLASSLTHSHHPGGVDTVGWAPAGWQEVAHAAAALARVPLNVTQV